MRSFDHLRILDLTSCVLLTDQAVDAIITNAPRIRSLVLAKCFELTDESINSICRLGRSLHQLHMGHVSWCVSLSAADQRREDADLEQPVGGLRSITDGAVSRLARTCTRLRYVDFACAYALTSRGARHGRRTCADAPANPSYPRLPTAERHQRPRALAIVKAPADRSRAGQSRRLSSRATWMLTELPSPAPGGQLDRPRDPRARRAAVIARADPSVVLRQHLDRGDPLPSPAAAEPHAPQPDGRACLSESRPSKVLPPAAKSTPSAVYP
jgi:hypothetical protein